MVQQRNSAGRFGNEDPVGPTPQTLAKLQPDNLLALVQNNILTTDQERAGREIACIWRALMRGLFGTSNAAGERSSPRKKDPTDAMTETESRWHAGTYLPWARGKASRLAIKFPRVMYSDIVYRLAVANENPLSVAQEFNVKPGVLVAALQDALTWYADAMEAREKADRRSRAS